MAPDQNTILKIIIDAAEEIDTALAEDINRGGAETVLFGQNARLDSLGLVTLITAVETRLQDRTGADILLVNEDAMSRSRSPFRTVQTLIDYIQEKTA